MSERAGGEWTAEALMEHLMQRHDVKPWSLPGSDRAKHSMHEALHRKGADHNHEDTE